MSCTRQKNKNNKEKPVTVDLNVCALCLGSEDDVEQYGKFFRCNIQNLAVHEYCLFFASGLAQNGEDHEGFDGFLYQDIVEEIKRASKLRCTLCYAKGAAIGCCVSKCVSKFHFKCGLEKNALFQFFGSFRSFCKRHRPTQKRLLSYTEPVQPPTCPICLCEVDRLDSFESLKSPCCKNAWFHRSCIQKQALANGMFFFRCAFCNNFEGFQEEMKQMGIYIPHRDAIWEQGDAYAELLHQYNRCDAATCLCPKGREYTGRHNNKRWKIDRCFACGQSGIHRRCQDSKMCRQYLCPNCVNCFPTNEKTAKNEQNDTLASTACETRPSDDSLSITDCPQNNETVQELNSSSTDLEENIPLSQLINHFKTKNDADEEEVGHPNDDGNACSNKDPFEHYNGLDNCGSSDSSSHVDVEVLSSDSSFTLSKDSSITEIENSNTDCRMKKRKNKKRKSPNVVMLKPFGGSTKAERRLTREKYAKRKQKQETHEELNQTNASSSVLKDDKDPATNNPECYGDNSEVNSTNHNVGLPLLGLDKGCSEKLRFEFSSNESLNEYFSANPRRNGSETNESDGGTFITANNKTGSSLEKEFQIDASSIPFKSIPSKCSDCSGTNISSGKKKLLQRDIRGMLVSKSKNKIPSPAKSSMKVVEDQGCQIMPMKKHGESKRRKLSVNPSSSESKSITTFMSTYDSSPERKSPKRKLATRESPLLILNKEGEKKVESTVSHSIIETMTAAKGMMMRALSRLNGSREQDDTSPIHTDSDSTESWKSGPTGIKHKKDSDSASTVVRKKSIEESDSDSSDSVKVVKVKRGRGRPKLRTIPLIAKKCSVPSVAHERHCECFMANVPKLLSSSPAKRAGATSDVIVIDDENDENDEQDSGKGSSRETSDVGMKSCDGSGAEEDENLENRNKDFSLHYSSFEDEDSMQFHSYDHDKTSNLKAISKLDTCEGGTSNVDDSKYEATNSNSVSQESKRTSNGVFQSSERVSIKSRVNGKKQVNQLDVVPSILSQDALEDPCFANNSSDECDSDYTLESLDGVSDTFSENNSQRNFKKKEKSSNSKMTGVQGQCGSRLNLPSSRKIKAREGHKKSLSLKKYMECSDEDFQGKKKFKAKAKKSRTDVRTGMNNKNGKKKLLKKKKLGAQEVEKFNNSSSAVVSNVSIAS